MDIRCFNDMEVEKQLRMIQAVGLIEKPQEQVLNVHHAVEEREMLGLGLGVGKNVSADGSLTLALAQDPESGNSMGWEMTPTLCMKEDINVADHLTSNMSGVVECDIRNEKGGLSSCKHEQSMIEEVAVDGKNQSQVWQEESMEGIQIVEENRPPEAVMVEEKNRWEQKVISSKEQDWYKHDCATGSSVEEQKDGKDRYKHNCVAGSNVEEQKEAKVALKADHCSWQISYRECQRNIATGKSTTVFDGCGEFMPPGGTGMDNNTLNCAACGCHRSFHRRAMVYGVSENGSREAREIIEAFSSVHEIVCTIRAGAGRALSLLAQDQQKFKVKDYSSPDQAVFVKSCIEALGQNAKAMLAIVDCLTSFQRSLAAANCVQQTGSLQQCLPALAPSEEIPKMEPKVGAPSSIYTSEMCMPVPFFPSKLGWQDGALCAMERAMSETSLSGQRRKRKRTRFTFDQLRKLNDFATRTGWTLAGVSKEEVDALCADVGIESVTLKYWIHNTRQKSRKKLDIDTKSPIRTP